MKDQKTITGTESFEDAIADLPAICKGTTLGRIVVSSYDACQLIIDEKNGHPIATETYEHLDRIEWIDDADQGDEYTDEYVKEAYVVRMPNRAKVTFIEDGRVYLNTFGLQSELQDELFTRWTPENVRVYTENGVRLVDITRNGYTYTVEFRNGMDVGDGVALLTHESIADRDYDSNTLIANGVGNDGVTWELWQSDHDYCPHCGRAATQWWLTSNRAPVCRRCVHRILDNRYDGPTEDDKLSTSRAANPKVGAAMTTVLRALDEVEANTCKLNWTINEGASATTATATIEDEDGDYLNLTVEIAGYDWQWTILNEDGEVMDEALGIDGEPSMEMAMNKADASAVKMVRGGCVHSLNGIAAQLNLGTYDETAIPDQLHTIARVLKNIA